MLDVHESRKQFNVKNTHTQKVRVGSTTTYDEESERTLGVLDVDELKNQL